MDNQPDLMSRRLQAFYDVYHHCYVSPKNNKELFLWIQKLRASKNKLDPELVSFLDGLGFDWQHLNAFDQHWMSMYQELLVFKAEQGHVRVPLRDLENKWLGIWVSEQRKRKHLLAPWKIDMLDNVGFLWKESIANEKEQRWLTMFEQLLTFRQEHGHARVPATWSDQKLASWVQHQREYENTMPAHRKAKLDAIGFDWYQSMAQLEDQRWEENFRELNSFKEANGHLVVPAEGAYYQLYLWVARQRKEEKTLSAYRKQKLDSIGFRWKRNIRLEQTLSWNQMYKELEEYHKLHRHCRVPTHSKEYKQLAAWVQRHRLRWNKLDKKKKAKLEALGFATSAAIEKERRQQWLSMLAQLKRYKSENGHCRVPSYYKLNKSLGNWVEVQRSSLDKLPEWKKQKLNAIGFEWSADIQNSKVKKWYEIYKRLKAFYEYFGHSNVPEEWADDVELARWVVYQRHPKKPLSAERIALLEQVKFEFNPKGIKRKRDGKGRYITAIEDKTKQ